MLLFSRQYNYMHTFVPRNRTDITSYLRTKQINYKIKILLFETFWNKSVYLMTKYSFTVSIPTHLSL